MARFTSGKYPALIVKFSDRSKVRFERGEVEVEGEQAQRLLDFAHQHPEYEIEHTDGEISAPVERETPKQRAQREARERGLDDSGTVAQIQARIDEHDAGANEPDPDDEDDDEPEGDDDEDGDPFADPQAQDD